MIIVFVLSALNSTTEVRVRPERSALVGSPERNERTPSSDGTEAVSCWETNGNKSSRTGYVADWNWFSDHYPSSFFGIIVLFVPVRLSHTGFR